MVKNLIVIIAATVALCAFTCRQDAGIKKMQWLIGTWENKTPRGSIYETWQRTNDKEFAGKSYMVREKDTMVFESTRLVQEGNALFYIPTVKDQNGGLPVRFAQKSLSATQVIFENPEHDFPQTISYTQINSDSLVAEIAGTRNGKQRKQTFPMKRMK